jgi:hypothetical protein
MNAWASRRKAVLRGAWVVLAAICVAELVVLRNRGSEVLTSLGPILLVAAPFVFLAMVHLALLRESWFGQAGPPSLMRRLKQGMYWILLVTLAIVLISFVWYFGF